MAWDAQNIKRTLLIEDYGVVAGKRKYALGKMCRVTDEKANTFMEPVPFEFLAQSPDVWAFDAIEFVGPTITPRSEKDGETLLNQISSSNVDRRTA